MRKPQVHILRLPFWRPLRKAKFGERR